ncbi:distal tail protein Dit [Fictibacillus aquaticus]|uniref:Phage tail protein n=1 Tax=Fictibacillus aquaticus TaxID=2021314 RepID=A0A235FAW2_9BACL|nr:distal tail protein Dit [Fictibacillus aquaticus]OYD58481.1 hypothetical protein CGZ90_00850 [Fictibacillus aquaticus]
MFRFKGIHASSFPFLTINKIIRPIMAPISNVILTVPKRPGGYPQGKEVGVKPISFEVTIKGNDSQNLLILADWLYSDDDEELALDKENGRFYYASLDGSTDLDEIGSRGKGTINFICSDPYSFGLPKSLSSSSGSLNMTYDGTALSFPKFRINVNQSTSFISLLNSYEEAVLLGLPESVDVIKTDQFKRILTDDLSSFTSWVDGSVVDNGEVKGTMVANKFRANSYGTGTTWHGPAKKRAFPGSAQLQDFRVQAFISQKSTSHLEVGRVEIYLLDSNSNIIGKMLLRDSTTGYKYNWAQARAGNEADNYVLYDGYGDMAGTWNDFSNGIIEIKRTGKVWEFYIAKRDAAGNHYARKSTRWRHTSNKYMAPLAQIQVHVGQYGTNAVTTQSINTIYVDEILTPGSNQVPIIANDGDVIEIDHHFKKITKNGADFQEVRDPRSTLFPLRKGTNSIQVFPPNIGTVEMIYQERWK